MEVATPLQHGQGIALADSLPTRCRPVRLNHDEQWKAGFFHPGTFENHSPDRLILPDHARPEKK